MYMEWGPCAGHGLLVAARKALADMAVSEVNADQLGVGDAWRGLQDAIAIAEHTDALRTGSVRI